jgi:hypothetical protein
MNKRMMVRLAFGLLLVLVLANALRAAGQSLVPEAGAYDLSWWTVEGGGGASSGGAYALAGTSGQFDAGVLTAGSYGLAGGFWAGAAASYPFYLPMLLN